MGVLNTIPIKLQAARMLARTALPYLSHALWTVGFIEDKGLGTLAINAKWQVRFDPEFVNTSTVDDLAVILYHEINHPLRDYFRRRGNRDVKVEINNCTFDLFNLAHDLEINDDLKTSGLEISNSLAENMLVPEKFDLPSGRLAEQYYDTLLNDLPKVASVCAEFKPCTEGESVGESGNEGESEGKAGISELELELIRQKVAEEISKHYGNVPSSLLKWAQQQLNRPVDPRSELKAVAHRVVEIARGHGDYTFTRPSRRQESTPDGLILPSMQQKSARIAIVVDTSDSIDDENLTDEFNYLTGLFRALRARLHVFIGGTEFTSYHTKSIRAIDTYSRGGTDMAKAMLACEQLRPRPDAIFVLTDGWTPWPKKMRLPVIVVLVGQSVSNPSQYGYKVVRIDKGLRVG